MSNSFLPLLDPFLNAAVDDVGMAPVITALRRIAEIKRVKYLDEPRDVFLAGNWEMLERILRHAEKSCPEL